MGGARQEHPLSGQPGHMAVAGSQRDVSWVWVPLHVGLPHSMAAGIQEQVSQENKVGVAGMFIIYPWKSLLLLVKAVTDVRPGSRAGTCELLLDVESSGRSCGMAAIRGKCSPLLQ